MEQEGTSSQPQPQKKKGLTRRDFVRWGAGTAGAGLAGGIMGTLAERAKTPPNVESQPLYISSEAEARLNDAGLGDFLGIYTESKYLVDTYGATIFPEFHTVCSDVIAGDVANDPNLKTRVERFTEGWVDEGDVYLFSDAIVKAHHVVDTLPFSEGTYEDDKQPLKNVLHKIADYYPPLIISIEGADIGIFSSERPEALSDTADGFYAGSHVHFSDPDTYERAMQVALHECDHAFKDKWDRAKPYMKKSKFIRFIEGEINSARSAAEYLFSTNEHTAVTMNYGGPAICYPLGITGEDAQRELQVLSSWEDQFYPRTSSTPDDDTIFGASVRFTELAHRTGSQLLEIRRKQSEDISLSVEEELFIHNYGDIRNSIMGKVFGELAHNHVGFSMLTSFDAQPDTPQNEIKLALERVKHWALSTGPVNASSQEIRSYLGLIDPSEVANPMFEEFGVELLEEGLFSDTKMQLYRLPSNPYSDEVNIAATFHTGMSIRTNVFSLPAGVFDTELNGRFDVTSEDEIHLRLSNTKDIHFHRDERTDVFLTDQREFASTGFNETLLKGQRAYFIGFVPNVPVRLGDAMNPNDRKQSTVMLVSQVGKMQYGWAPIPIEDGFVLDEECLICPVELPHKDAYLLRQGDKKWLVPDGRPTDFSFIESVREENGAFIFTTDGEDILTSHLPDYLKDAATTVVRSGDAKNINIQFQYLGSGLSHYLIVFDDREDPHVDSFGPSTKSWLFPTDNLAWASLETTS